MHQIRRWRTIAVPLVLILVLILSACSGGKSEGGSKSDPVPVQDEKKQVTLTFSSFQFAEEPAGTEWKRQIAAFEQQHPDIKVNIEAAPLAQYPTKIVASAMAKQMPDIVSADLAWIQDWARSGYLADLNDQVQKAGGDKFTGQYYKTLMDLGSRDGKLYGVPRFAGPYVLQYNTDMFQAAGLDPSKPPTTWDELLADAQKLTKKDASGNVVQYGIGLHGQNITANVSRFVNWMYQNGADVFSADKQKAALDSPEAIAALKYWSELYTKHKVVPPGVVQTGPGNVRSLFAQKKIAMMLSIPWGVDLVLAENPALKSAIALAPFPSTKPGSPAVFQAVYDAVSATSQHKAEAFALIQFLNSGENQKALYQKTHYTPARPDVYEMAGVKDDPYMKVVGQVNQNLKPLPSDVANWSKISDVIGKAMQTALTGTKTADEAFKEANQQVNDLLKQ